MAAAKKACLIVIDGWGISENTEGNAIYHADTPVMDAFSKNADQYLTLDASGLAVGLPDGLMGNSEVGHLNIGAGRVLYQDIVRINKAVQEKTLVQNKNLIAACNKAKNGNGRLHFLGLVSDGGVHSHIDHLFSFLECAKELGVPKTFVQYFADGRDTRPTSGVTYVQQVLDKIKELQYGSLALVVGRYYAMDRDKRFERNKIAFEGMVQGIGETATPDTVIEVIKKRYDAKGDDCQTDEFLKPIIVDPDGRIQDGDTLVFIDFRADRMRQIVEAFGIKPQFETDKIPKDISVNIMTQYKKEFPFPILFPPEVPKNVLAEWLSVKDVLQYHVAETEKYAHVTFFFNGGQEAQFEGEERKLVPSPKVATYDLQPEMSCDGVAKEVCGGIRCGKFPFVMCNFAAPDMVGHTGKYEPAVTACTATDLAIGKIKAACDENGYVLFITADHGNAEKMYSDQGGPHTAHTTYRVPLVMHNTDLKLACPAGYNAALCDVATTILDVMGIEQPPEMTGRSLLVH
ncbi:2,3-bisphosphoglycerate-independent phosphoglycerate mutase-like [Dendronephthya gigantea]|uniref:2,3-bisphosphoglycerate-independent phosphoglycerate mutase-like n=1 Tax=Dendronephthya gigantea TaxID=151771 RepID=UPI00106A124C|nr:2,3-bisphosphoglycerate-independent phosphoglycerate mutase-like [Dendronephthya gigantea]